MSIKYVWFTPVLGDFWNGLDHSMRPVTVSALGMLQQRDSKAN